MDIWMENERFDFDWKTKYQYSLLWRGERIIEFGKKLWILIK